MSLYKINEQIKEALEKAVDMETGEVLDAEVFEELDALQIARDEKIENILLWIKNLTAEEEELKKEKQSFEDRMKRKKKKAESLRRYVGGILAGQKFETSKVAVSWRRSEITEYNGNVYALPEECINRKDPEVNKTALKKLLKSGVEIPGAQIVEKQNLMIK